MPSLRKKVLMFVSTTAAMNGKAWIYFPLSMKAQPSGQWRRKAYVTHSGEGEGLLFFGNVILPFVDHFPKDLELYRILTTKLNEISEGTQK